MLRGSWRHLLAIGLAGLLALGAAGAIFIEATRSEALYQHQADQAAKAERDSAAVHAQRACALVPLPERAECQADEEDAARERERQEYDLQAQLVTSAWTRAMGMAALIATVASIIGVGLVWVTFGETRRATMVAQENLKAFREAERGHCEVTIVGGNASKTSDAVRYFGHIQNTGRTAVKILSVRSGPLTDPICPTDQKFKGALFDEFTLEAEGRTGEIPLAQGLNNIDRFPYIGGYVEYRCKFGNLHRSFFCYGVTEPKENLALLKYSHYTHECKRERDWPQDT